ncbi:LysR family transcriptional regulator [Photobacterium leiognathi]|uniref:LysR family transcriptional regulator n=1 Tax=Photobacterium leiognathi TaxID=553611 RepID=UPI003AF38522
MKNRKMLDFKAMAIFARVVEHGSMTKAASNIGIAVSAVSSAINKLEQTYQVKLFNRSTRYLELTDAGKVFYQGCKTMLEGAESAEVALEEVREQPNGVVKITMISSVANTIVITALSNIKKLYPSIQYELNLTDDLTGFLEQKPDIIIWGEDSSFDDSRLISFKLAELNLITCASNEYLSRSIPINHPHDLIQHCWLGGHNERANWKDLHYSHSKLGDFKLTPPINTYCNNVLALLSLAKKHLGITIRADIEIENELRDGQLTHILPGWKLKNKFPLYLITLNRTQPAKTRVTIDEIKKQFNFYIDM